jgi:hypothetical protein
VLVWPAPQRCEACGRMLHSGVRLRETSRAIGQSTCQGRLAQLGERCVRNAEVGGSIPPPSTNLNSYI